MRLIPYLAILLPLSALAQTKTPAPTFGKVDKSELLLKNCEFDKNAGALVLYESAKMYFDINGGFPYAELQHFMRIKILTDKGLDDANIKLRYRSKSNEESIVNLLANTYNLDGAGNVSVTKLDKKSIYQKKINARYSEEAFSLPDVKVGSVIEVKYTWKGHFPKEWTLQKDIPVQKSHYEIDFPQEFELHVRPICTLPFKSKDESTRLRTIKTFDMENIPGLRDERYISCDRDYLQRIENWIVAYTAEGRRYPFIKTWQQVSESLMEDADFGVQLKKDIPRTAELDAVLKAINDPYKKMLAIHNYVKKNMTWDGYDNFWALNGVKAAWKDKVGTAGEINMILVNLLKNAGLKADPILVSTRENGRITPLFPDVTQFNKVMAFVVIGDKHYVLDGTDKYTPSGLIPEDVMFTDGMVIDPQSQYGFHFESLWDESRMDKNVVIFRAAIDDKGEMSGHATVTSSDYARVKRAPQLSDRSKYMDHFFKASNSDYRFDSLVLKNTEVDSMPLVQEFDFHCPVNASGEYSYFTVNMFNDMGKNPFVADSRFSDVFFGTKQSYQIIGNVSIPEGYTFEELPKNMRMMMQDKSLSVTRMVAASGNMINARIVVDFRRPFYTPEEYPDLKEFYKKMYALLDEQIVIKKKQN
jgi:hypothetical protein